MCLIIVGVTCLNSLCVVWWRWTSRWICKHLQTCRHRPTRWDPPQLRSVFAYDGRQLGAIKGDFYAEYFTYICKLSAAPPQLTNVRASWCIRGAVCQIKNTDSKRLLWTNGWTNQYMWQNRSPGLSPSVAIVLETDNWGGGVSFLFWGSRYFHLFCLHKKLKRHS